MRQRIRAGGRAGPPLMLKRSIERGRTKANLDRIFYYLIVGKKYPSAVRPDSVSRVWFGARHSGPPE